MVFIMVLLEILNTKTFKVLDTILLHKYLGVGLLDHVGILFLTFWGTSVLFSIAAVPFCIPTNSLQAF